MNPKNRNIVSFQPVTREQKSVLRVRDDSVPLADWKDEDLMLAFGEGNEEAFAELLRRHERSVFNYMYRMIHNWHIAEELTQEVFMAIVSNASRYQPTAKFTTYLFTIASNIISKEWGLQNRRPRFFSLSQWWNSKDSPDDNHDWSPIEHQADPRLSVWKKTKCKEISEAINEALKKIPVEQRETFVLRRFLDLSYEEIANIMDIPIGTAKTRVLRTERALRPYLEEFREYLNEH
ncbi:MAG TPA: sigma-70 family RNA polymerase sigma factor [Candidatus Hydrogenedens sp.]|nr:sigma-70 family RNA polymerase sigma factor [Candidatus Hydrogenedens sp.]HPP58964.1 sigma-70 family RNA polymerase sigma factor [Candidatus Hydrogenedens sp.]